MLLLAFDTATPAVTVALHDGDKIVAAESAVDARRQGELLAPFIDRALASAGAGRGDLTAIAVGTGPGPYTGLRAGLVTARVLGSALGIPVDGWCTLDIIAAAVAAPGGEFLVATDARRKELYWARYSAGRRADRRPGGVPRDRPGARPPRRGRGRGAVSGPGRGADRAPVPGRRRAWPPFPRNGSWPAISPSPAEPLYLRRPDAREPGQRKRVTP